MNIRKKEFRELLKSLENTKVEEYKYIGTGNPYSNILIIGKETAFEKDSEQYKVETLTNFDFWNNIYEIDESSILEDDFYPRYPYKGQLLKRDNKINNGTSVTWMNYQKLMNYIYDDPLNDKITFHDHSFITEVNSTPSKKTSNASTDSIAFRKDELLKKEFFNSFKVVIISGVGYFEIPKDKDGKRVENEIEEIFGVEFKEKKFASENSSQPYWIHYNNDKSKILINTHQLSIGISDKLLREVALEIINSNILSK